MIDGSGQGDGAKARIFAAVAAVSFFGLLLAYLISAFLAQYLPQPSLKTVISEHRKLTILRISLRECERGIRRRCLNGNVPMLGRAAFDDVEAEVRIDNHNNNNYIVGASWFNADKLHDLRDRLAALNLMTDFNVCFERIASVTYSTDEEGRGTEVPKVGADCNYLRDFVVREGRSYTESASVGNVAADFQAWTRAVYDAGRGEKNLEAVRSQLGQAREQVGHLQMHDVCQGSAITNCREQLTKIHSSIDMALRATNNVGTSTTMLTFTNAVFDFYSRIVIIFLIMIIFVVAWRILSPKSFVTAMFAVAQLLRWFLRF